MISPYENLANAIVELAAKDYRKALKDLKRSPVMMRTSNESRM